MKRMKIKILLFLLALLILFSATALATDLEIIYPNVSFRSKPGGNVIGTFTGGEVLNALAETWAKEQLWYYVHSDMLGDGYVSSEYARPIYADERVFNPETPTEPDCVTENVANFYTSLFRWLYVYDYCYWDADEQSCTYRVNNGIGTEGVVKPIHKWDIAYMLLRYGLLVENEQTTLLCNEDASSEEKIRVSSLALTNHFGTDDVWKIIFRLLNNSEIHAPHGIISQNDMIKMSAIRDEVNAEYSQKEINQTDITNTSVNLVLYYNPNGGTYYHVDANCPSTSAIYLPLSGAFMWEAVNAEEFARLRPCTVCGAPTR